MAENHFKLKMFSIIGSVVTAVVVAYVLFYIGPDQDAGNKLDKFKLGKQKFECNIPISSFFSKDEYRLLNNNSIIKNDIDLKAVTFVVVIGALSRKVLSQGEVGKNYSCDVHNEGLHVDISLIGPGSKSKTGQLCRSFYLRNSYFEGESFPINLDSDRIRTIKNYSCINDIGEWELVQSEALGVVNLSQLE